MNLTRRGRGAVVVLVVGTAMAVAYGSRSLEALLAPVFVALVVSAVQTRWATRPGLHRIVPDDGFVGESRTVTLETDVDVPVAGRLRERVGDGLSATGIDRNVTIDDEPITYEVDLEDRGVQELGPLELSVTDALGLTARTFSYPATDELLVYPRVYEITGGARHQLNLLAGTDEEHIRDEFDNLREYERGDSLRDIHWKSSAKRPEQDLVVKEFIAEEDLGSVVIVGEAEDGVDAMAEACASVALYLLDAGIDVGLAVPGATLAPDTGSDHRLALLRALAETDGGEVDSVAGDLHVRGTDDDAVVTMNGRSTSFATLAGTRLSAPRAPDQPTAGRTEREVVA